MTAEKSNDNSGYYYRQIGSAPDGKPIVVRTALVSRRDFSKMFGLGVAGAVAVGTGLDAVVGFPVLKRAVRELEQLSGGANEKQGSEPNKATVVESEVLTIVSGEELFIVSETENPGLQLKVVEEKIKEIPDLEVVFLHSVTVGKQEQKTIVPLSKKDLEVKVLEENRIPVPKPLVVKYWNGANIKLVVPEKIWGYILTSYQISKVNPYLLTALLHSETPSWGGSSEGRKVTSPVGAGGLFQFMPGTWRRFTAADMASDRYNPLASTLAAGKMVASIGLSEKFNNALKAKLEQEARYRKDPNYKRDNKVYETWRMAFLNQFAGRTKGAACWNMHWGQATYVFDTAIKLTEANSNEVETKIK